MQISKMVKAFFVFWLVIPVLVVTPARAADQSSNAGRIIKSASELDYPLLVRIFPPGMCTKILSGYGYIWG